MDDDFGDDGPFDEGAFDGEDEGEPSTDVNYYMVLAVDKEVSVWVCVCCVLLCRVASTQEGGSAETFRAMAFFETLFVTFFALRPAIRLLHASRTRPGDECCCSGACVR